MWNQIQPDGWVKPFFQSSFYVEGICCGTGHPGHPSGSTTGQRNHWVSGIDEEPTNCQQYYGQFVQPRNITLNILMIKKKKWKITVTTWWKNLVLWDRFPSLCPQRHDACWCTSPSLLMQRYYQHSMDQAVVAAFRESRCCREDLCWPHSRPGISVLWARNDHPRALLDEVCIMGRFLSLKDESMWHEEENFHPISPPDYPTTYSSLIACCVS